VETPLFFIYRPRDLYTASRDRERPEFRRIGAKLVKRHCQRDDSAGRDSNIRANDRKTSDALAVIRLSGTANGVNEAGVGPTDLHQQIVHAPKRHQSAFDSLPAVLDVRRGAQALGCDGGVIGGAYAVFEAVIGVAPAQTASLEGKQGPGVANSRKWTPVEIKREVAQLPPVPAYVVPSNAARARVAKNVQKRVVVVAQTAAPTYDQRMAAYVPVQSAYAPVERPRSFGPFSFGF
jgi:hypothetical protein